MFWLLYLLFLFILFLYSLLFTFYYFHTFYMFLYLCALYTVYKYICTLFLLYLLLLDLKAIVSKSIPFILLIYSAFICLLYTCLLFFVLFFSFSRRKISDDCITGVTINFLNLITSWTVIDDVSLIYSTLLMCINLELHLSCISCQRFTSSPPFVVSPPSCDPPGCQCLNQPRGVSSAGQQGQEHLPASHLQTLCECDQVSFLLPSNGSFEADKSLCSRIEISVWVKDVLFTSLEVQQEPAVTEVEVSVISVLLHQFKQLRVQDLTSEGAKRER